MDSAHHRSVPKTTRSRSRVFPRCAGVAPPAARRPPRGSSVGTSAPDPDGDQHGRFRPVGRSRRKPPAPRSAWPTARTAVVAVERASPGRGRSPVRTPAVRRSPERAFGSHRTLEGFTVTDGVDIARPPTTWRPVQPDLGRRYGCRHPTARPRSATRASSATVRGPFGEGRDPREPLHDGDGDGVGILIQGNEITGVRENGIIPTACRRRGSSTTWSDGRNTCTTTAARAVHRGSAEHGRHRHRRWTTSCPRTPPLRSADPAAGSRRSSSSSGP